MKLLTTALTLTLLGAALSADAKPMTHPDTSGDGWKPLFKDDLSNAIKPDGVWTAEDGVFTASEDQAIWSDKDYDNFVLDLDPSTSTIDLVSPSFPPSTIFRQTGSD